MDGGTVEQTSWNETSLKLLVPQTTVPSLAVTELAQSAEKVVLVGAATDGSCMATRLSASRSWPPAVTSMVRIVPRPGLVRVGGTGHRKARLRSPLTQERPAPFPSPPINPSLSPWTLQEPSVPPDDIE